VAFARPEPLGVLIYFVRAVNLWNGVSPILPMLFIGIAALWLSVSELRRQGLSEEHVVTNNFLSFGEHTPLPASGTDGLRISGGAESMW